MPRPEKELYKKKKIEHWQSVNQLRRAYNIGDEETIRKAQLILDKKKNELYSAKAEAYQKSRWHPFAEKIVAEGAVVNVPGFFKPRITASQAVLLKDFVKKEYGVEKHFEPGQKVSREIFRLLARPGILSPADLKEQPAPNAAARAVEQVEEIKERDAEAAAEAPKAITEKTVGEAVAAAGHTPEHYESIQRVQGAPLASIMGMDAMKVRELAEQRGMPVPRAFLKMEILLGRLKDRKGGRIDESILRELNAAATEIERTHGGAGVWELASKFHDFNVMVPADRTQPEQEYKPGAIADKVQADMQTMFDHISTRNFGAYRLTTAAKALEGHGVDIRNALRRSGGKAFDKRIQMEAAGDKIRRAISLSQKEALTKPEQEELKEIQEFVTTNKDAIRGAITEHLEPAKFDRYVKELQLHSARAEAKVHAGRLMAEVQRQMPEAFAEGGRAIGREMAGLGEAFTPAAPAERVFEPERRAEAAQLELRAAELVADMARFRGQSDAFIAEHDVASKLAGTLEYQMAVTALKDARLRIDEAGKIGAPSFDPAKAREVLALKLAAEKEREHNGMSISELKELGNRLAAEGKLAKFDESDEKKRIISQLRPLLEKDAEEAVKAIDEKNLPEELMARTTEAERAGLGLAGLNAEQMAALQSALVRAGTAPSLAAARAALEKLPLAGVIEAFNEHRPIIIEEAVKQHVKAYIAAADAVEAHRPQPEALAAGLDRAEAGFAAAWGPGKGYAELADAWETAGMIAPERIPALRADAEARKERMASALRITATGFVGRVDSLQSELRQGEMRGKLVPNSTLIKKAIAEAGTVAKEFARKVEAKAATPEDIRKAGAAELQLRAAWALNELAKQATLTPEQATEAASRIFPAGKPLPWEKIDNEVRQMRFEWAPTYADLDYMKAAVGIAPAEQPKFEPQARKAIAVTREEALRLMTDAFTDPMGVVYTLGSGELAYKDATGDKKISLSDEAALGKLGLDKGGARVKPLDELDAKDVAVSAYIESVFRWADSSGGKYHSFADRKGNVLSVRIEAGTAAASLAPAEAAVRAKLREQRLSKFRDKNDSTAESVEDMVKFYGAEFVNALLENDGVYIERAYAGKKDKDGRPVDAKAIAESLGARIGEFYIDEEGILRYDTAAEDKAGVPSPISDALVTGRNKEQRELRRLKSDAKAAGTTLAWEAFDPAKGTKENLELVASAVDAKVQAQLYRYVGDAEKKALAEAEAGGRPRGKFDRKELGAAVSAFSAAFTNAEMVRSDYKNKAKLRIVMKRDSAAEAKPGKDLETDSWEAYGTIMARKFIRNGVDVYSRGRLKKELPEIFKTLKKRLGEGDVDALLEERVERAEAGEFCRTGKRLAGDWEAVVLRDLDVVLVKRAADGAISEFADEATHKRLAAERKAALEDVLSTVDGNLFKPPLSTDDAKAEQDALAALKKEKADLVKEHAETEKDKSLKKAAREKKLAELTEKIAEADKKYREFGKFFTIGEGVGAKTARLVGNKATIDGVEYDLADEFDRKRLSVLEAGTGYSLAAELQAAKDKDGSIVAALKAEPAALDRLKPAIESRISAKERELNPPRLDGDSVTLGKKQFKIVKGKLEYGGDEYNLRDIADIQLLADPAGAPENTIAMNLGRAGALNGGAAFYLEKARESPEITKLQADIAEAKAKKRDTAAMEAELADKQFGIKLHTGGAWLTLDGEIVRTVVYDAKKKQFILNGKKLRPEEVPSELFDIQDSNLLSEQMGGHAFRQQQYAAEVFANARLPPADRQESYLLQPAVGGDAAALRASIIRAWGPEVSPVKQNIMLSLRQLEGTMAIQNAAEIQTLKADIQKRGGERDDIERKLRLAADADKPALRDEYAKAEADLGLLNNSLLKLQKPVVTVEAVYSASGKVESGVKGIDVVLDEFLKNYTLTGMTPDGRVALNVDELEHIKNQMRNPVARDFMEKIVAYAKLQVGEDRAFRASVIDMLDSATKLAAKEDAEVFRRTSGEFKETLGKLFGGKVDIKGVGGNIKGVSGDLTSPDFEKLIERVEKLRKDYAKYENSKAAGYNVAFAQLSAFEFAARLLTGHADFAQLSAGVRDPNVLGAVVKEFAKRPELLVAAYSKGARFTEADKQLMLDNGFPEKAWMDENLDVEFNLKPGQERGKRREHQRNRLLNSTVDEMRTFVTNNKFEPWIIGFSEHPDRYKELLPSDAYKTLTSVGSNPIAAMASMLGRTPKELLKSDQIKSLTPVLGNAFEIREMMAIDIAIDFARGGLIAKDLDPRMTYRDDYRNVARVLSIVLDKKDTAAIEEEVDSQGLRATYDKLLAERTDLTNYATYEKSDYQKFQRLLDRLEGNEFASPMAFKLALLDELCRDPKKKEEARKATLLVSAKAAVVKVKENVVVAKKLEEEKQKGTEAKRAIDEKRAAAAGAREGAAAVAEALRRIDAEGAKELLDRKQPEDVVKAYLDELQKELADVENDPAKRGRVVQLKARITALTSISVKDLASMKEAFDAEAKKVEAAETEIAKLEKERADADAEAARLESAIGARDGQIDELKRAAENAWDAAVKADLEGIQLMTDLDELSKDAEKAAAELKVFEDLSTDINAVALRPHAAKPTLKEAVRAMSRRVEDTTGPVAIAVRDATIPDEKKDNLRRQLKTKTEGLQKTVIGDVVAEAKARFASIGDGLSESSPASALESARDAVYAAVDEVNAVDPARPANKGARDLLPEDAMMDIRTFLGGKMGRITALIDARNAALGKEAAEAKTALVQELQAAFDKIHDLAGIARARERLERHIAENEADETKGITDKDADKFRGPEGILTIREREIKRDTLFKSVDTGVTNTISRSDMERDEKTRLLGELVKEVERGWTNGILTESEARVKMGQINTQIAELSRAGAEISSKEAEIDRLKRQLDEALAKAAKGEKVDFGKIAGDLSKTEISLDWLRANCWTLGYDALPTVVDRQTEPKLSVVGDAIKDFSSLNNVNQLFESVGMSVMRAMAAGNTAFWKDAHYEKYSEIGKRVIYTVLKEEHNKRAEPDEEWREYGDVRNATAGELFRMLEDSGFLRGTKAWQFKSDKGDAAETNRTMLEAIYGMRGRMPLTEAEWLESTERLYTDAQYGEMMAGEKPAAFLAARSSAATPYERAKAILDPDKPGKSKTMLKYIVKAFRPDMDKLRDEAERGGGPKPPPAKPPEPEEEEPALKPASEEDKRAGQKVYDAELSKLLEEATAEQKESEPAKPAAPKPTGPVADAFDAYFGAKWKDSTAKRYMAEFTDPLTGEGIQVDRSSNYAKLFRIGNDHYIYYDYCDMTDRSVPPRALYKLTEEAAKESIDTMGARDFAPLLRKCEKVPLAKAQKLAAKLAIAAREMKGESEYTLSTMAEEVLEGADKEPPKAQEPEPPKPVEEDKAAEQQRLAADAEKRIAASKRRSEAFMDDVRNRLGAGTLTEPNIDMYRDMLPQMGFEQEHVKVAMAELEEMRGKLKEAAQPKKATEEEIRNASLLTSAKALGPIRLGINDVLNRAIEASPTGLSLEEIQTALGEFDGLEKRLAGIRTEGEALAIDEHRKTAISDANNAEGAIADARIRLREAATQLRRESEQGFKTVDAALGRLGDRIRNGTLDGVESELDALELDAENLAVSQHKDKALVRVGVVRSTLKQAVVKDAERRKAENTAVADGLKGEAREIFNAARLDLAEAKPEDVTEIAERAKKNAALLGAYKKLGPDGRKFADAQFGGRSVVEELGTKDIDFLAGRITAAQEKDAIRAQLNNLPDGIRNAVDADLKQTHNGEGIEEFLGDKPTLVLALSVKHASRPEAVAAAKMYDGIRDEAKKTEVKRLIEKWVGADDPYALAITSPSMLERYIGEALKPTAEPAKPAAAEEAQREEEEAATKTRRLAEERAKAEEPEDVTETLDEIVESGIKEINESTDEQFEESLDELKAYVRELKESTPEENLPVVEKLERAISDKEAKLAKRGPERVDFSKIGEEPVAEAPKQALSAELVPLAEKLVNSRIAKEDREAALDYLKSRKITARGDMAEFALEESLNAFVKRRSEGKVRGIDVFKGTASSPEFRGLNAAIPEAGNKTPLELVLEAKDPQGIIFELIGEGANTPGALSLDRPVAEMFTAVSGMEVFTVMPGVGQVNVEPEEMAERIRERMSKRVPGSVRAQVQDAIESSKSAAEMQRRVMAALDNAKKGETGLSQLDKPRLDTLRMNLTDKYGMDKRSAGYLIDALQKTPAVRAALSTKAVKEHELSTAMEEAVVAKPDRVAAEMAAMGLGPGEEAPAEKAPAKKGREDAMAAELRKIMGEEPTTAAGSDAELDALTKELESVGSEPAKPAVREEMQPEELARILKAPKAKDAPALLRELKNAPAASISETEIGNVLAELLPTIPAGELNDKAAAELKKRGWEFEEPPADAEKVVEKAEAPAEPKPQTAEEIKALRGEALGSVVAETGVAKEDILAVIKADKKLQKEFAAAKTPELMRTVFKKAAGSKAAPSVGDIVKGKPLVILANSKAGKAHALYSVGGKEFYVDYDLAPDKKPVNPRLVPTDKVDPRIIAALKKQLQKAGV